MNRAALLVIAAALVTTTLAGCLGDGDDIDSAIPRARVTVSEVDGKVDTFFFDASGSSGRGLKFEWSFGDGTTGNEATMEHTYTFGSATYTPQLLITDSAGATDVWEGEVVVGNGENGAPIASFIPQAREIGIGVPFQVNATATLDPEGDPVRYEWDFNKVMSQDEYLAFREKKMHQDEIPEEEGTQVSNGNEDKSRLETPGLQDLRDLPLGTAKSPGPHGGGGHNGEAWDISLTEIRRTTSEPTFTLEEGFSEPAVYVVMLTAYDIKGATREVLSQDAWAVKVTDSPKQVLYADEHTNTLTLGGPSIITSNTTDDENYRDQDLWRFNIPDPIDNMYLNVTWTQNLLYEQRQDTLLANDIDIVLRSPNGKVRSAFGADEGFTISLNPTASDAMGFGDWKLEIYGTNGLEIEFTATYWAMVDVNPFRDIEEHEE